jgi:hypothetical protein
MKNLLVLLAGAMITITTSQAIECPNLTLSCEHKVLTKIGYYQTVETKTANFIGVNDDEPSLPPNECNAYISFQNSDLSLGNSLNITVKEDLDTFLYLGITNGAANPQFEVIATPNKYMTISAKKDLMTCILK